MRTCAFATVSSQSRGVTLGPIFFQEIHKVSKFGKGGGRRVLQTFGIFPKFYHVLKASLSIRILEKYVNFL